MPRFPWWKYFLGFPILSFIYACISKLRRMLYKRGLIRQLKLPIKVISVGNLSMGGSGKTPMIQFLGHRLAQKQVSYGVVARPYKAKSFSKFLSNKEKKGRSLARPLFVESKKMAYRVPFGDLKSAEIFGDEPTLLARSLAPAPVVVGPKKYHSADKLYKEFTVEAILVDDGFQHLQLERDFNIVLIDASDEKAFSVFPMGRGRESKSSLKEADWILVTKINYVDEESLKKILQYLPTEKPRSLVEYQMVFHDSDIQKLDSKGNRRFFVCCGIASAQIFIDELSKKFGERIAIVRIFSDHHSYSQEEITEIQSLVEKQNLILITTSKDLVKLEPYLECDKLIPSIRVKFKNEDDPFFKRFDSLFSS